GEGPVLLESDFIGKLLCQMDLLQAVEHESKQGGEGQAESAKRHGILLFDESPRLRLLSGSAYTPESAAKLMVLLCQGWLASRERIVNSTLRSRLSFTVSSKSNLASGSSLCWPFAL